MKTKQKFFTIIYILFLIFSFVFIRYSIKDTKNINVEDKNSKKSSFEVKPVKVFLKIESQNILYEQSMQNVDTILDLFEELRLHKNFWYEKISYIYGTEIDNINHVKSPQEFSWKVFEDENDITYEIGNKKLEDQKTYEIKLTRILER